MITYKKGNALDIHQSDKTYIIHCCNAQNAFGAGFAQAVAQKYPVVKNAYHDWFNYDIDHYEILNWRSNDIPKLGCIQFVDVQKDLVFVNMIGQEYYYNSNSKKYPAYDAIEKNKRFVSYDALVECFKSLKSEVQREDKGYTIQSPRLGSGLAGGDWRIIEAIMESSGLDFVVYDL